MAPSGDVPNRQSQQEIFALSKVIPQEPSGNSDTWSRVESCPADSTGKWGAVRVTGPLFTADSRTIVGGRVPVPAGVFKGVYDPIWNEAAGLSGR